MLGFIVGLVSLIALITIIGRGRRRRWLWHHAHPREDYPACHGGPRRCGPEHGPHGRSGPWDGRSRRSSMMWRLFERLDTAPGQEKVIRQAVTDVEKTARAMRGEIRKGGGDLSQALRGDAFDEAVMGLMFARQDERVRELQLAFTGALARIHEALDPRQREMLADLLESPRGMAWGGPYRGFA